MKSEPNHGGLYFQVRECELNPIKITSFLIVKYLLLTLTLINYKMPLLYFPSTTLFQINGGCTLKFVCYNNTNSLDCTRKTHKYLILANINTIFRKMGRH